MNCTFAKWWDNEPGGGEGGGGFWYSKSKAACAQVGRDYSLILVKKNCCSLALWWWSFLSSYTVCKYLFKKSKISPFKFYIIFFLLPLLTSDSTFRFIQYWYIIFATTVQCVIRYTNFDLWILLNNNWIKYSFPQFNWIYSPSLPQHLQFVVSWAAWSWTSASRAWPGAGQPHTRPQALCSTKQINQSGLVERRSINQGFLEEINQSGLLERKSINQGSYQSIRARRGNQSIRVLREEINQSRYLIGNQSGKSLGGNQSSKAVINQLNGGQIATDSKSARFEDISLSSNRVLSEKILA